MIQKTTGTVVSVTKQWWLKINTKPIRSHALDGAEFPHIIKVEYTVNNINYTKRKWLNPGTPVPNIDAQIPVLYYSNKPSKAKIL